MPTFCQKTIHTKYHFTVPSANNPSCNSYIHTYSRHTHLYTRVCMCMSSLTNLRQKASNHLQVDTAAAALKSIIENRQSGKAVCTVDRQMQCKAASQYTHLRPYIHTYITCSLSIYPIERDRRERGLRAEGFHIYCSTHTNEMALLNFLQIFCLSTIQGCGFAHWTSILHDQPFRYAFTVIFMATI